MYKNLLFVIEALKLSRICIHTPTLVLEHFVFDGQDCISGSAFLILQFGGIDHC